MKIAGTVRAALMLLVACSVASCTEMSYLGANRDAASRDASVRATPRTDECGNGLDDDSNGRIDDGCPCGPGETQACFGGALSSRGVGSCRDGTQTCASSREWGDWGDYPCVGDVRPSAEVCDGADHDCDGARDEDCPCTNGATVECGLEFLAEPCTGGTQTCRGGRWSACEGGVSPSADVCGDRVDNDCDGETDDLCGCVPEPELCRDGIDNDCDDETDEPACMPDWPPRVDAGIPSIPDGGPPVECECRQSPEAPFGTVSFDEEIVAPGAIMHTNFKDGAISGDRLGLIMRHNVGFGAWPVVDEFVGLSVENGATLAGPFEIPLTQSDDWSRVARYSVAPVFGGFITTQDRSPEDDGWTERDREGAELGPFDADRFATSAAVEHPDARRPRPRVISIRFIEVLGARRAVWLECHGWELVMTSAFGGGTLYECSDPALMWQELDASLATIGAPERLGAGMTQRIEGLADVVWSGTHLIVTAWRQAAATFDPTLLNTTLSVFAFSGARLAHRHDHALSRSLADTVSVVGVRSDRVLHCFGVNTGFGSEHAGQCELLGLDATPIRPPFSIGAVESNGPHEGLWVSSTGCAFVVVAWRRRLESGATRQQAVWFTVDPWTGALGADVLLGPLDFIASGPVLAVYEASGALRTVREHNVAIPMPPRPPDVSGMYRIERSSLVYRTISCEPAGP